MPRRIRLEKNFLRCRSVHGHAQEPTPSSEVQYCAERLRKTPSLIPKSNIAGSWARRGGHLYTGSFENNWFCRFNGFKLISFSD